MCKEIINFDQLPFYHSIGISSFKKLLNFICHCSSPKILKTVLDNDDLIPPVHALPTNDKIHPRYKTEQTTKQMVQVLMNLTCSHSIILTRSLVSIPRAALLVKICWFFFVSLPNKREMRIPN